jgi:hypothetical protein
MCDADPHPDIVPDWDQFLCHHAFASEHAPLTRAKGIAVKRFVATSPVRAFGIPAVNPDHRANACGDSVSDIDYFDRPVVRESEESAHRQGRAGEVELQDSYRRIERLDDFNPLGDALRPSDSGPDDIVRCGKRACWSGRRALLTATSSGHGDAKQRCHDEGEADPTHLTFQADRARLSGE